MSTQTRPAARPKVRSKLFIKISLLLATVALLTTRWGPPSGYPGCQLLGTPYRTALQVASGCCCTSVAMCLRICLVVSPQIRLHQRQTCLCRSADAWAG
ncbi:hypothetical protein PR003_g6173 [Phytophthora rubi]|uniref:Uncharacterized protein n=1 Tax=Phytophthora rubi TaxID=129364 RepID=A0A6A4FR86_9STRA|nr:hypothetical protein PR002_g3500 [Phytophthora rubi]KAE9043454.1 hypothetical protein PR001_g5780 [Phytophthora rubi]KAE9348911.1 hypothetical protein PR003_g6173 [Phytophthora rubi]